MQTSALVNKILEFGKHSKYSLAQEIGVSWHCIHAYQRGWYEAGFKNMFELRRIYDRLNFSNEKGQLELFDPVKMHNDEALKNFLYSQNKKLLDPIEVL